MNPKTVYHLILQDAGRKLQVVADIISSSPFPRIEPGDNLRVKETNPSTWDVVQAMVDIAYSADKSELHISTCLVVDSPCARPEEGTSK